MQHCPPVTFNIVGCYMLGPFLHPVACCCWNRSNFKAPCERTQNCNCLPKAPNIVGCYMLGPFAQLLQHCWGHARALHMVCLEFTKSYRYVSFPRCPAGPNIVWSCRIRLHTTAKTDTTIPNSVASVFTGLDLYRFPLFKCVCVGRGGLCRAGRREPWERGCLFLIISYDA